MKKIFVLLLASLLLVFTSCTSIGIAMHGKDYFLGKKESWLIKYFGYDGIPAGSESEYDKIIHFTNKTDSMIMSKTTIVTYKTSRNKKVYSFIYAGCSDGCLLDYNAGSYHYRPGSYSTGYGGRQIQIRAPEHRNDNRLVSAEINRFYSEVKRLNAVLPDKRQAIFDQTAIGSCFFVYNITKKYEDRYYPSYAGRYEGIPSSETLTVYICDMWRVNVEADNKSKTETYKAYIFDDRSHRYYDDKYNSISEEKAFAAKKYYVDRGFTAQHKISGIAITAYIKDGKVVRVE